MVRRIGRAVRAMAIVAYCAIDWCAERLGDAIQRTDTGENEESEVPGDFSYLDSWTSSELKAFVKVDGTLTHEELAYIKHLARQRQDVELMEACLTATSD